jgi:hypothetical protein
LNVARVSEKLVKSSFAYCTKMFGAIPAGPRIDGGKNLAMNIQDCPVSDRFLAPQRPNKIVYLGQIGGVFQPLDNSSVLFAKGIPQIPSRLEITEWIEH